MANGVVNRNDRKEGKEIEFESKIGISMERGREGEREKRFEKRCSRVQPKWRQKKINNLEIQAFASMYGAR